jgi:hypothetical protein
VLVVGGESGSGVVVGVVAVVGVDAAGGVVVTAAPPRFTAPPHAAVVPVFVTITSVTTSVTPAGTVNASTAVLPIGTARVISTMFCTTGMLPAVGAVVEVVGVTVGVVVVWAPS